jgi:hypothetical protein
LGLGYFGFQFKLIVLNQGNDGITGGGDVADVGEAFCHNASGRGADGGLVELGLQAVDGGLLRSHRCLGTFYLSLASPTAS